VIAVDTNLLVYAHRRDSPWHGKAAPLLRELAEGVDAWAIPWPCLHEFLGIVTHPRIYSPPTPVPRALAQVDAWLESPALVLLVESDEHWPALRGLLGAGMISGPRVHDARVAALCIQHRVQELWTADREFGAIAGLSSRNPLVDPAPGTGKRRRRN
jgi:toxin-antitoxin system PIN domain toxin